MNRILSLAAALGACTVVATSAWSGPEKITFPADYKQSFTFYATVDRADNNQVRKAFANPAAVTGAKAGAPLPAGAQIVMEVYDARLDYNGKPALDAAGKFIPGDLKVLAVMEKGEGWGAAYPEAMRNGDWEYAFFKPDGSLKADTDVKTCFECHKPQVDSDYMFLLDSLVETASK